MWKPLFPCLISTQQTKFEVRLTSRLWTAQSSSVRFGFVHKSDVIRLTSTDVGGTCEGTRDQLHPLTDFNLVAIRSPFVA